MAGPAGTVALANDAWAAWDKETTYGTEVTVGGASEFGLFISEGLADTRTPSEPPTITQAHRLVGQLYDGPIEIAGPIEFPIQYAGFENLLLHACGEINNAGAGSSTGTFVRDYDLSPRGRYKVAAGSPSLSVHVSRGIAGSGQSNPSVWSFLGCVIDEFEFRQGGPFDHLAFIPTFLGQDNPTPLPESQTPSFDSSPVVNGTECTATWGGVEIFVSDFSIRVRRNHDRNRRRLGRRVIEEPPPGRYLIEGNFTTEWDGELRAGSPAVAMLLDYRNRTPRELKFAYSSSTNIPTTSSPYLLDLVVPQCVMTSFPNFVRSEGRVTVNVNFRGYASSATTPPKEFRVHHQSGATFADN